MAVNAKFNLEEACSSFRPTGLKVPEITLTFIITRLIYRQNNMLCNSLKDAYNSSLLPHMGGDAVQSNAMVQQPRIT